MKRQEIIDALLSHKFPYTVRTKGFGYLLSVEGIDGRGLQSIYVEGITLDDGAIIYPSALRERLNVKDKALVIGKTKLSTEPLMWFNDALDEVTDLEWTILFDKGPHVLNVNIPDQPEISIMVDIFRTYDEFSFKKRVVFVEAKVKTVGEITGSGQLGEVVIQAKSLIA